MTRVHRTFEPEFKLQLVKLYENGMPRAQIAKEYGVPTTSLDRWIKNHRETGDFKDPSPRTAEDKEMIRLKKENQRLRMEVDILKQAALIMGRR